MSVEVGQAAPELTLSNQFGEKVSLADFRGEKNVVLMLYPFAFTGPCTGELCAIRDQYVDFANDDTVVLSVSCDSPYTLKVFGEQEGLTHSLLSDFWPHGEVSKAYGVFDEDWGTCMRGTFLIDKDGNIVNQVVNMGIADRRDQSVYIDWIG